MGDFYRRAVKKLDKLDSQQRKELLVSAVDEINLLETVLDSINVGILVCDEYNNLVLVNKSAKRLLPLNETEGVKIWDAVRDTQIIELLKEIVLNEERVAGREIDVIKQNINRLLSVSSVPLVQDGRITGSIIYVEDITEQRKGEARLRRAENLASLTTLAAGVAHEIKNPLGSISIYLQLLQKTLAKENMIIEETTGKYFNVLKEEIDRLNRIVVDFLFAVRPMPMELRESDINSLVLQVIEFVTFELRQADIQISLELRENLPKILMDERYMKQALLNLITNAKSAMPDGGTLNITTKCVDNEIILTISDTGEGISKENISKIFEPYFTTKETGTGLGLTQVYKIIREHQGEISVHSKEKKGTSFEIIIPAPRKATQLIGYNKNAAEGEIK